MSSSARNLNYNGFESRLVPRTPRSRAGRPVSTFDDAMNHDNEDLDEVDMLHLQSQQSHPLLRGGESDQGNDASGNGGQGQNPSQNRRPGYMQASPSSPSVGTPTRSRSKPFSGGMDTAKLKEIWDRTPLYIGLMGAFVLFVMIILSFHRPDVLQKYITKTNSTSPSASAVAAPNKLQTPIGGHPSTGHGTASSDSSSSFIDYSNYTNFPLEPIEYEEECYYLLNEGKMSHGDYWTKMPGMDLDVPHENPPGKNGVCSSTITYMLDGNVGLFFDLALLAQTAALARERNRTLIVDDRYWNRGRWTEHFVDVRETQPGPEPGCYPPPPEELVACPRTARHWVVTQRTARFHFGHGFGDEYEDPYKSDVKRWLPIFNHALESFQTTIIPNEQVRKDIRNMRQQYTQKPYIGMHIRHGDRYPSNQKWRGDYVPTSEYVKAAEDTWDKLRTSQPPQVWGEEPIVYLASDSYAAFEDYRSMSADPDNVWSLYSSTDHHLKYMASPHGYVQRVFQGRKTRKEERVRWTQGMLVDFALLSGMWLEDGERGPSAVICTATSNICKMGAVGLGWDRSFGKKLWVDVDLQGSIWPPWDAFEYH